MVQKWNQAPENTLESLRHAIQFNDGIEFDLRLTSDQELILHHDAHLSVPEPNSPQSLNVPENHALDELTALGSVALNAMLEDPVIPSR